MKNQSGEKELEGIKGYKVIFPVIIGLAVIVALFWGELFPKPHIMASTDGQPIQCVQGDTLTISSRHRGLSSAQWLNVNVDNIARYCEPGTHIACNGQEVFRVLEVDTAWVHCVVVEDIEIPSKNQLSIEGQQLYVPNVADALAQVHKGWRFYGFIFLALLLMIGRDLGYVMRIRILSDKQLSWLQSLRVIILWEFTSAITPSAVGGTSVAILYVNKEGLSVGKSSAIVMATSLLDEIYFVVMFPLLILLLPSGVLFNLGSSLAGDLLMATIFTGYFLKLGWVLVLGYGMFFNPKGLKWLIVKIFSLPLLRRWKGGAEKAGDEVVTSSVELKHKPAAFWLKAGLATFLSWTSRYWVVNALFMAFFVVHDHFLIFARQLVMWIMMLVSPTPGGSGFAEFVFRELLGEFIPVAGLTIVIALLWRIISYYLYLLVGVMVVPAWVKSKFGKKK